MSEKNLIMRAAAVSRMAPREWTDFLGALAAYRDETTTHLLKSPELDQLPRLQGRAHMAAHLFDVFNTCAQTANKIEETERKQK